MTPRRGPAASGFEVAGRIIAGAFLCVIGGALGYLLWASVMWILLQVDEHLIDLAHLPSWLKSCLACFYWGLMVLLPILGMVIVPIVVLDVLDRVTRRSKGNSSSSGD